MERKAKDKETISRYVPRVSNGSSAWSSVRFGVRRRSPTVLTLTDTDVPGRRATLTGNRLKRDTIFDLISSAFSCCFHFSLSSSQGRNTNSSKMCKGRREIFRWDALIVVVISPRSSRKKRNTEEIEVRRGSD